MVPKHSIKQKRPINGKIQDNKSSKYEQTTDSYLFQHCSFSAAVGTLRWYWFHRNANPTKRTFNAKWGKKMLLRKKA